MMTEDDGSIASSSWPRSLGSDGSPVEPSSSLGSSITGISSGSSEGSRSQQGRKLSMSSSVSKSTHTPSVLISPGPQPTASNPQAESAKSAIDKTNASFREMRITKYSIRPNKYTKAEPVNVGYQIFGMQQLAYIALLKATYRSKRSPSRCDVRESNFSHSLHQRVTALTIPRK